MISLTLHIWRQDGPNAKGGFETCHMKDIDTDISFLEMMDLLNEQLMGDGKENSRELVKQAYGFGTGKKRLATTFAAARFAPSQTANSIISDRQ